MLKLSSDFDDIIYSIQNSLTGPEFNIGLPAKTPALFHHMDSVHALPALYFELFRGISTTSVSGNSNFIMINHVDKTRFTS